MQFPLAGVWVILLNHTTLLMIKFRYTTANRQFPPLILDKTSPNPLGLWSFICEVPKAFVYIRDFTAAEKNVASPIQIIETGKWYLLTNGLYIIIIEVHNK